MELVQTSDHPQLDFAFNTSSYLLFKYEDLLWSTPTEFGGGPSRGRIGAVGVSCGDRLEVDCPTMCASGLNPTRSK